MDFYPRLKFYPDLNFPFFSQFREQKIVNAQEDVFIVKAAHRQDIRVLTCGSVFGGSILQQNGLRQIQVSGSH